MNVVVGVPPNFDEIDAMFHVRGKPVIFAWGDRIYNPLGGPITPALMAHERMHGARQGSGDESIRAWWRSYLHDPSFRRVEEVLAHRAEYHEFARSNRDRNRLNNFLAALAQRMASSMYGGMMTARDARKAILSDAWPN